MTRLPTLVAVATGAHFILWLSVLGLMQLTGATFVLHFYLWLIFPLVLLPDMPWLPSNWFTASLAAVLNSGIYGFTFGLLIYAIRKKLRRPVA